MGTTWLNLSTTVNEQRFLIYIVFRFKLVDLLFTSAVMREMSIRALRIMISSKEFYCLTCAKKLCILLHCNYFKLIVHLNMFRGIFFIQCSIVNQCNSSINLSNSMVAPCTSDNFFYGRMNAKMFNRSNY